MVKGITRQVVVVKGTDPEVFEQAIFLVRDDVVAKGGVTDQMLLQQASQACRKSDGALWRLRLLWGGCGASLTGLIWLLSILF